MDTVLNLDSAVAARRVAYNNVITTALEFSVLTLTVPGFPREKVQNPQRLRHYPSTRLTLTAESRLKRLTCVCVTLVLITTLLSGCSVLRRSAPLGSSGGMPTKVAVAVAAKTSNSTALRASRSFVSSSDTVAKSKCKSKGNEFAGTLPRPQFSMTPEVKSEIQRLVTRERGTVTQILARKNSHNEMLNRVFEEEGVPIELVNVAAVESRFNPEAKSPAGAKGMWQFMGGTARSYGLRVTNNVDDRTDPVRSTVAAAKHLKDLFLSYNDWHLALAAYNAGIGTINRLVNKDTQGGFWDFARAGKLSGETSNFVPRVIALSIIIGDPEQYGFTALG